MTPAEAAAMLRRYGQRIEVVAAEALAAPAGDARAVVVARTLVDTGLLRRRWRVVRERTITSLVNDRPRARYTRGGRTVEEAREALRAAIRRSHRQIRREIVKSLRARR